MKPSQLYCSEASEGGWRPRRYSARTTHHNPAEDDEFPEDFQCNQTNQPTNKNIQLIGTKRTATVSTGCICFSNVPLVSIVKQFPSAKGYSLGRSDRQKKISKLGKRKESGSGHFSKKALHEQGVTVFLPSLTVTIFSFFSSSPSSHCFFSLS